MIYIGNAPCSWGTLEFEATADSSSIGYAQMLDELAEAGYTGTELGDWGFMPTEPAQLRAELAQRNLTMTGAFVPVAFQYRDLHADGETRAVKIAALLASVADAARPPFLVLADDNCREGVRCRHAGRVTPDLELDDEAWRIFTEGVNQVARAVQHETGLRCVFHHHGGGYVETPDEIARLLELTDPEQVSLVFDTGHYAFGTGHPDGTTVLEGLRRFAPRIRYVHLKDCSPQIAAQSRAEGWDYHTSIRHGVFCELGQGCVPFDEVAAWLREQNYAGFVTVEQDVLPGMGSPKASAQRNRQFLKTVGL